ncbi:aryl-alcohol dehydrogenase-like predicted oxidoreductase [Streptosporangium album]|uniref:Aryl-alcohol dehydrogenase-like predicted oxidoreductase n=1 Tax=Streptosporangium album TaxID=47479 RepID=A0A7W7W9E9_9ACTN|nr:aldo/keto reductase [Streptosporangium album]MBB4938821.1 aryl-alcohol dehydrogenase-like predicted oxidoreductase [Streptosporangium album]
MNYVRLGDSGLKVSRACLGTMNFGTVGGVGGCDEAEATRVIDAFLDAGNNFVDTADLYHGGESEEILGRALRGRRDSVVVATKGSRPQGPGPNDQGLSRAHLTRALEASLRRLGTGYIDLYQCHIWDAETPIEETMATLDGFVRSGKVRYLGCSNFTAPQIVQAQWAAERVGGTRFVSLQPQYSLVARLIEVEILQVCRDHGLGAVTYAPLGGGVLSGRYRRDTAPGPDSRMGRMMSLATPAARRWARDMLSERSLGIADEVAKVAAELGTTSTAVAIAWVAARPGVTSVVIGPRNLEQYGQNAAGFALELPSEVVARLEEVSRPGDRPITGASW